MAIPSGPCATNDNTCCVSLYDIAYHLLTEAYDAVNACYPSDCCDPLRAYVTMGTGDDGVVDSVTVAVRNVTAITQNSGGFNLRRAGFEVMLRESGWPTARVENDTIILPDPAIQAAAAKHMLANGEAIDRRLGALVTGKALVPVGIRCTNGTVGTMTPLDPDGGVAGWSWLVNVDVPWN